MISPISQSISIIVYAHVFVDCGSRKLCVFYVYRRIANVGIDRDRYHNQNTAMYVLCDIIIYSAESSRQRRKKVFSFYRDGNYSFPDQRVKKKNDK